MCNLYLFVRLLISESDTKIQFLEANENKACLK